MCVLLVSTVVDSVMLSVFEGCDCVSCLAVLAMYGRSCTWCV